MKKMSLKKGLKAPVLGVFFALLILLYIVLEVNVPAIKEVPIAVSADMAGTKIVQISDGHGRGIKENGRLMRAIRSFSPDMIVLTGDMIDESTTNFSPPLSAIKTLSSIAPTFFIPGNHERANPKGDDFINLVRKNGASVMLNESEMVGDIALCGIDDISLKLDDVFQAMSGYGKCDILLSHSPAIYKSIEGLGIPLVFAGHTHGGQVRLPILGELILPDKDIPDYLVKGVYSNGETVFHISTGLGTSVAPIRFMCRAEINLITLVSE
ncbi:MAG: metallophosphoesterase [Candidatus Colwellbacteria bacterium]|jgi:hypothetical protein|nr:metallophosphoesterase [Candidatus Colwellbacteria bacterium]MDD3752556.1 metallophosphoesterase [Candidatus Colwellbacteria bacterium]MDD4818947.1 metallophosphoesterase [Candidatus Colwellbacteria bacterium]